MNTLSPVSDAPFADVYGEGRDSGKTYKVMRIDALDLAGYVLRLVAALRVESYEGLLADIEQSIKDKTAPLDTMMGVLQGCDPRAIHSLILDVLLHVRISPDPRHPSANRPLENGDVVDIKTLGAILQAVASLHFDLGDPAAS